MRPTRESVLHSLVQTIHAGRLLPGDRLPSERELATELGVSRQTVREALKTLVDVGYVEKRRGRYGGTFVCEDWTDRDVVAAVPRRSTPTLPGHSEAVDLEVVARELEFLESSLVARLAAEPLTADQRQQLVAAYEAARHAPLRSYHSYDTAFHLALASILGLPSVLALVEQCWAQLNAIVLRAPVFVCSPQACNGHHWDLMQAILAGDQPAAVRASRIHLRALSDLARTYL